MKMEKIKRYFYINGYKIKNNLYKEPTYIQKLHKESVEKIINRLPKNNLFDKKRIIYTSSFPMTWKVTELWQEQGKKTIVY
jgi:hypothetical protein